MHARVFRAADVFIDGKHFVDFFAAERFLVVFRIDISQIIPAAAYEGVERVGIAFCVRAANGAFHVHKFVALFQRAFAVGREVDVVRKFHGQILFGDGHRAAVRTMDNGNGRAPITLTRDKPVAQTIVGFEFPFPFFFKFFDDGDASFFGGHTVKFAAVAHYAVVGIRQIVGRAVLAFYYSFDGQAVLFRENVVAVVVRRNAHNRARAVTCKDVIGNENGDFPAVYRVDCVTSREHARLFARGRKTFNLVNFAALQFIVFDNLFVFFGDDLIDKRAFGRENDVRDTENRVGARREHAETDVLVFHLELDFAARGFTDPVFLHKFGFFGPVEFVDVVQKFFGVFRDAEEPLRQIFTDNRRAASFAATVDDLLVRKNGLAGRAPVDRRFLSVRQIVFIHLQKQPLRPFIILRIARDDLVIPIVCRADVFKLFFHRRDVFHGAVFGMNTRFYRVVFGRQTERVESHRLEHFVALHTLKARETVRRSVVEPVSDVQLCARRIRKHFKDVILLVDSRRIELIGFFLFPFFIPFCFDFEHVHIGNTSFEKIYKRL